MKITLVTGNAGKLAQFQALLPADITLASTDIDLPEIQSLDSAEIGLDKAKRAYEVIGTPVLVDDTSAGLEKLGGLPGPFIKFFEKKLGQDALYQLAGAEGQKVIVDCTLVYFDGTRSVIGRGVVSGTAVSARGENGFGFDACFMPDGYDKTYAEMSADEKNAMSHRTLAVKDLLEKLSPLN